MLTDAADGTLAARDPRAGRWQEARDAFLAQLAVHPDGRGFESLAQALWWLDDGAACLVARERAYRLYRDAHEDAAAAGAASSAGYDCFLFGEGESVAHGWLGRARELLEPLPEHTAHGWLAVREAELSLATGADPQIAHLAGHRGRGIGQRLGAADLEYAGMALSGLAQTVAGDPEAGMPLLDSAVAAATTGEVTDLMWMGKIFCWLITACQQVHDLSRADEWCRRVETVCRALELDPLFTVCRIQHASILLARGAWQQAEQNLTHALRQTRSSRRHTRLDAVALLGELRRRQGRWVEAEALLGQAEFDPSAIVTRALIRLARGEAGKAWADIRTVLSTIPRSNRLGRVRYLLPGVLSAAGAGEHAAAAEAADELRETAALLGNSALAGLAASAAATLAEPADEVRLWREAVLRFHEAHLTFDEAESRVKLAAALARDGDLDAAGEQITTVLHDLASSLGSCTAVTDAKALSRKIRSTRRQREHNDLTDREAQILRMVAEGMTNQLIARALTLSPHTVHRHVANILTKLDQPSRAAAAAHAITHGLV